MLIDLTNGQLSLSVVSLFGALIQSKPLLLSLFNETDIDLEVNASPLYFYEGRNKSG